MDARAKWRQELVSWKTKHAHPATALRISSEAAEGEENETYSGVYGSVYGGEYDQFEQGQAAQAGTQSVRIPFYDRTGYRRYVCAASPSGVAEGGCIHVHPQELGLERSQDAGAVHHVQRAAAARRRRPVARAAERGL